MEHLIKLMEENFRTVISINDYSHRVYRAPSKIISIDDSNTGFGLFSAVDFKKQDEVVNYSGNIKHIRDIKRERMDPMYVINLWEEWALCGDSLTDLGLFANCCSNTYQAKANVSFNKEKIRIFNESGFQVSKGWNKCHLYTNYRATFPLVAIGDIKKEDELLLKRYSNDRNYLCRMRKFERS